MNTDNKTFAVRDVSRALIAFGVLIMLLNFNQYLFVYLLGIVTLVVGIINLFTLNLKIKLMGALNMAVAGIYFILFAVLLYPDRFGSLANLVFLAMGAVLLVFSLRFLYYYQRHKKEIHF